MSINYHLNIENPHQHYVKVSISLKLNSRGEAVVFMPSWSPGSYLLREYARLIRKPVAVDSSGRLLDFQQIEKGSWKILGGENLSEQAVEFEYEVYCHELTVRTSYVDEEFAFIHGPSVFMGVKNFEKESVNLRLSFPGSWSKISTGLKDVSCSRESFEYCSPN